MRAYVRTVLLYWWAISVIECIYGQGIAHAPTEVDAECFGSAKENLGDRDVVIIAGIGGSGTRGVRHALRVYGPRVLMCNDPKYLNHCGDAVIFHSLRQNGVIKKIMEVLPPRTLYFNRSAIGEDIWDRAYDAVACKGVRILAECSGGLGPIKAEKDPMAKEKKPNPDLWAGRTWGWKTGEASKNVNNLDDWCFFGQNDCKKQVVRDGRDVAYSKNQGHFSGFSQAFYGHDSSLKTAPNPMYARQMFWADINRELIEFGRTYIPGRHFLLRMEDLTLSEEASKSILRSLFEFVGGLPPKGDEKASADWLEHEITAASKFFLTHRESYGGNKLSQEDMNSRLSTLRLQPGRVRDSYQLMGYNLSAYGTASHCSSAPACGVIS